MNGLLDISTGTKEHKVTGSILRPCTLGLCAAIASLTGCVGVGSESQLAPIVAVRNVDKASVASDREDSALLYVSDSSQIGEHNGVSVYSFPHGRFLRDQKHFAVVGGMCTDAAQHLYVTYTDLYQIDEYAHGGVKPIKILADPSGSPVDCSVDPTTGNLAVSNGASLGGLSNILVYNNARGIPKTYTQSSIAWFYFCTYDAAGNLFADGYNSSFQAQFVELPKGSAKFTNVGLNQTVSAPGQMKWDGHYIAIQDVTLNPVTIDRFSFSGSQGSLDGTTQLSGTTSPGFFWIDGDTVIGVDSNANQVLYWRYPAGGSPVKTISSGVTFPNSVAVSKATGDR
jgi:hypothetical protein